MRDVSRLFTSQSPTSGAIRAIHSQQPHQSCACRDMGISVASFPICEYWLDSGWHADYERAREDAQWSLLPSSGLTH